MLWFVDVSFVRFKFTRHAVYHVRSEGPEQLNLFFPRVLMSPGTKLRKSIGSRVAKLTDFPRDLSLRTADAFPVVASLPPKIIISFTLTVTKNKERVNKVST